MPARLKNLLLLGGAAAGSLVPTAWVSLPAAAVLTLWLPGWLLIGVLRGVDRLAGRAWLASAASLAVVPVLLAWVWRVSNDRWIILAALVALNAILCLLWPAVAAGLRAGRPNGRAVLGWRGLPGCSGRSPCRPFSRRPTHRFPLPASRGQRPAPRASRQAGRLALGAIAGFVAACVFGSYWVPEAGGRVGVRAAHDYIKHHAVLHSLEHHPLPLRNVFYAAERDTPYYYYQYHYHLPATLRKLSGDRVSNGLAFGLTSAALAVVFVVLTYLLAREVVGSAGGALLAAACVSLVGGWDALPVLIRVLAGHPPPIVLDSWSPCPWRIHNLMTQYMWCPQHVAAVAALMLGALWLRHAPQARWWVVIAPVLLAAILGTSAYIAMTTFATVAAYLGLRLWESLPDPAWRRRFLAGMSLVAVLTALLGGWQAWGYYLMNQRYPSGLSLAWDRFNYAALGRLLPPGPLANYLDAPWILLVDLGLPAAACVLVTREVWSRLWRDRGLRLLLLAGAIGTLTLFTVHSTTNPIDYGFRVAVKPLQVIAAICAGAMLVSHQVRPAVRRWRRPLLVGGILLGLPVGLYEAPLMVVRTLLLTPADQPDAGALRFLRERTPPDAVVQADPTSRIDLPQLIERQMGVCDPDDPHVRVFFPRDMQAMQRLAERVEHAFRTSSGQQAYADLRAVRATHVLVGRHEQQRFGPVPQFDDPAWFDRLYADQHARVYRIREDPAPPSAALDEQQRRSNTP